MRVFYVAAEVRGAEGVQVWKIRAEDEAQAVALVEGGEGEFLDDHSEIIATATGPCYVLGEGQEDTKRLKRESLKDLLVKIRRHGERVEISTEGHCEIDELLMLTAASFCGLARKLRLSEDQVLAVLVEASMALPDKEKSKDPTIH